MTRQAHEHFELLIFKIMISRKGEHAALLLRAIAKDRPRWVANRLYVGRASTLLIAFNPDNIRHMNNVHETVSDVIHHVHSAGFTSEELIPPLELLSG